MINNRITAVVLAGGGSARMGTNKALLKLGNKTMIERVVNPLKSIFNNVLVVTNNPEEYSMLSVKFAKDCINTKEKNSLIGLYSGLKQSETSHVFVIGCDMPFVNVKLIKYMASLLKNEDIIVPFVEGYYQPLHAIYGNGCIPQFEKFLQKKQYKITNIFELVNIKKVSEKNIKKFDPNMLCFENINTYTEYLQIKDKFQ